MPLNESINIITLDREAFLDQDPRALAAAKLLLLAEEYADPHLDEQAEDGSTLSQEEQVATYIKDIAQEEIHYVAVRNGTDVVGAASTQQLEIFKEPYARNITATTIYGMYVPLVERRQNIGRTLMARVAQDAIEHTSAYLFIDTDRTSLKDEGARKFLHVVGFARYEHEMRASSDAVLRRATSPQ